MNLNSSGAWLPAQVSGAGPFAPVREFGGAGSVVSWTTLSPRAALTVPLWKRLGAVRLVAGYSRYYHLLPAAYANFANPTALLHTIRQKLLEGKAVDFWGPGGGHDYMVNRVLTDGQGNPTHLELRNPYGGYLTISANEAFFSWGGPGFIWV